MAHNVTFKIIQQTIHLVIEPSDRSHCYCLGLFALKNEKKYGHYFCTVEMEFTIPYRNPSSLGGGLATADLFLIFFYLTFFFISHWIPLLLVLSLLSLFFCDSKEAGSKISDDTYHNEYDSSLCFVYYGTWSLYGLQELDLKLCQQGGCFVPVMAARATLPFGYILDCHSVLNISNVFKICGISAINPQIRWDFHKQKMLKNVN